MVYHNGMSLLIMADGIFFMFFFFMYAYYTVYVINLDWYLRAFRIHGHK